MKKILGIAIACVLIASACNAAIIISQYYEGTSNNKWIELFNTGSADVDLGAGSYRLGCWANSSNNQGWKTGNSPNGGNSAISGTIQAGKTFVLRHSAAVTPSYAVGTVNAAVNFNGDDTVILYTGGTLYNSAGNVDVFGVTRTAGTASSPFADQSYERKITISTGTSADFNSDDWNNYTLATVDAAASTDIAYIGYHMIPEPAGLLGLVLLSFFLRRK